MFRGFNYGVFIPKTDIYDKSMARDHMAWLKETRQMIEGQDYHWVTTLSGPRGMGESFYFQNTTDALYFKLARGGKDFV